MKDSSFVLVNIPGRCRWCGCTDDRGCANGCGWADRAHTLCTECEPIDKAMRTAKGRKALAEFVQTSITDNLGILEIGAR